MPAKKTISELLPLVAQNKFNALTQWEALAQEVAGSNLAPEIAQVGRDLEEFHFREALERLIKLAETRGWEIKVP